MFPSFPGVDLANVSLNLSQDPPAQRSIIRSLVSDPFLKLQNMTENETTKNNFNKLSKLIQ